MSINKELKAFESKVLELAKIDNSLIDNFIIKHGFDSESLMRKELQDYENKELKAFESKVLELAKIDNSLIDNFIIKHGFASELSFNDSVNLSAKIFRQVKQSRQGNLAYELSKNKELQIETIKNMSGTDLVNYFFFYNLNFHKDNFQKIFTLSNVIKFVNKFKVYNSQGHFQYLAKIAKKNGLRVNG